MAHVLLQQLVIFANVHILTLVLTVKESLSPHLPDQSALALFVHVQHLLLPLLIHVFQTHVKITVVVLLLSM